MNLRAIVTPYEGDTFEPFETVIERPYRGEFIVRRPEFVVQGQPGTFGVEEIVVLESRWLPADQYGPRRSIDMVVYATPVEPRRLPL